MGILSDVGGKITGGASLSSIGGGVVRSITILVLVFVITAVVGAIVFFITQNKKYNKKITLFENLAGQGYVPTGKDRAMTVKLGDGGEEVLYFKKGKVYRTAYGKKIGKNHYAFAKGSDGYWYNITFGDLDQQLKQMKMEPIDRDMRYMHVAIRRNIAHRFEQKNWLKENIGLLVGVASIVIVLIFMWLLADKYLTIGSTAATTMDLSNKVLDRIDVLLGKMDNICSGGSGVVKVPV